MLGKCSILHQQKCSTQSCCSGGFSNSSYTSRGRVSSPCRNNHHHHNGLILSCIIIGILILIVESNCSVALNESDKQIALNFNSTLNDTTPSPPPPLITTPNVTSSEGKTVLFRYNSTIPASSVIPVAFNITEDNSLDNLRILAHCANKIMCNFMIVTHEGYLEFLKESSPSLKFLRAQAMVVQILNITNLEKPDWPTIVYIDKPGSYVFLSVNPNSENGTLLSISGELKYSYGRGFVWFLQNYWYIIIIGAALIVFSGITIAVIANGVKGRDLFNGMTSYTKKNKSPRCLLTDDDMKEEIGFKTVSSFNILQGEELRTYSSDSDKSIGGYTNSN